jgi:hypothetical protein
MAACCQCARSRSARYISTPPPSTMALPPSRRRECCVSPATGQPRQATYNSACQIPTAMRAAPKSGARDGPAWVPQPAAARSAAGTASGMTTRKYAAIARPLNQRALRKGTRGAEDSSLSAARLGRTQRATGTSAGARSSGHQRPARTAARGHLRRHRSQGAHSWQRPRLRTWLTHRPRGRPTAGTRSGTLITRADSPMRQNALSCAFATDRQLTVEAAPNGGYLKSSLSTP